MPRRSARIATPLSCIDELLASDLFLIAGGRDGAAVPISPSLPGFPARPAEVIGRGTASRGTCERAATALEDRGDRNAALDIAMIGGDAQLAAAILARAVETSFDMSSEGNSHVAIRAWLRGYGKEAVHSDPETMLQLLLVLAMSGGQDVTSWLTEVERALRDDRRVPAFPSARGVGRVGSDPRDPLTHALPHNEVALQWAQKTSRRHPILEALPVQLANIFLIEGDLVAASHAIEWILRSASVDRYTLWSVISCCPE